MYLNCQFLFMTHVSDILNHKFQEFSGVVSAKQGKWAPELPMCGHFITNTDLTVMIKSICTGVFFPCENYFIEHSA